MTEITKHKSRNANYQRGNKAVKYSTIAMTIFIDADMYAYGNRN
jgi:hypothetical protein